MLIAIDISGDMLYVAEGGVNSNAVVVGKCNEAKLPEGTVDDGAVKNHAALVSSVTRLLSGYNYRSSSAVATFTSSSVISRRLSLPPGKPFEIKAMVKNQMSQSVGDPAEFVFEYAYATAAQPKDAPADVWVYAVERSLVDSYYAVFKSLKLRPVALDIHANCVEKLLFGAKVNGADLEGRSTLFVDIERDYAEIHLFSGYERGFSRISPVSAADFIRIAASRGYGMPEDDLKVIENRLFALSPAGPANRMALVSYDALDVSSGTLSNDPVLAESARTYITELSDELMKMVQFQMMRNSSMPVSHVYIYGSFSDVKGLAAGVSQALSCPVEKIESISKIKSDKNVNISKYINAVGALIRL